MKRLSFLSCLALPGLMLAACKTDKSESTRTVFFDTSGMDTTVNPADDFLVLLPATG